MQTGNKFQCTIYNHLSTQEYLILCNSYLLFIKTSYFIKYQIVVN